MKKNRKERERENKSENRGTHWEDLNLELKHHP